MPLAEMRVYVRAICLSLFVFCCSSYGDSVNIKPFTSDGCSLFPDDGVISQHDWCECCFVHDVSYWKGGTKEQRRLADEELKACVLRKTENEALANLMYSGVRFGGSPYFYNWYRWGYGWPYKRKYQALSEQELRLTNDMIDAYLTDPKNSICLQK